jgi:hypothetical protein
MELLRGGERHAKAAGDEGEDVRGAFQILLAGADAGEAPFDLLETFGSKDRDLRSAAEMLDVKAKRACGGDAAGGGVRLIEQAGIAERGHDVADGGGTHAILVAEVTREGLRRDRLTGSDVRLDDGRQDVAFARTQARFRSHADVVKTPGKGWIAPV